MTAESNPLPDFSEDYVKEVYARFGLAMYWAQALEREIGIMLAAILNPRFGLSNADERERAFDDEFSKTLGQLVAKLRQESDIPPAFEDQLREAVRTRNWLAHNYFWERASHFLSPEGRQFMLDELNTIANQFRTVNDVLSPITQRWLESAGVPEEVVEAEFERLIVEGRLDYGGA